MSAKDQVSLTLIASGIFLLFYNLGSMTKVASINNGQVAQQVQQEEVSNAR